MDRREFLKTSASIPILALLKRIGLNEKSIDFKPSKSIKPSDFNPEAEYGNSFDWLNFPVKKGYERRKWYDEIKKVLYKDMINVVPENYRHRIQFIIKIPTDYGRKYGIAWHFYPDSCLPDVVWSQLNDGYGLI